MTALVGCEFLTLPGAAIGTGQAGQISPSQLQSPPLVATSRMAVTPGTRFGIYEVVESLGRGGMGEVYLARDSRLHRDVALKVLSDRHRLDPQQEARFEREARALAALNHPNIATVLGVETTDGVQALVMELVDGQTLAERIGRNSSPASGLPIPEALRVARQLVDALDASHQRGIVHRDLKPANIKIRRDNVVKVLDFGLAKAFESENNSGHDASTVALTAEHTVVGTPAYMSPEQARGQPVDQRTDIWAFGCVLFEMLSGRRAFDGGASSEVMAAVLEREPDYEQLPKQTPFLVRRLVKRCLEKDPRRRLREIADARVDLDDAAPVTIADEPLTRRRRAGLLRAIALTGVIAAAGAMLGIWLWPRRDAVTQPVHVTALLPAGVTVSRGPGRLLSLALSPDGRTLVISCADSTGERLYKRTLDRPEAMPMAGTESGANPFFSHDGAWVGFVANRRLKRVPVDGGAAVDIAPAPGRPAGASWGDNDRIVFAGLDTPLKIVDARGGTPEDLMPAGNGPASGGLYPHVLAGGRTVLFNEGGWIHAFDLVSRRRTDRIIEGVAARYSPPGYLLLTRGTTLLAAPFDPARLEIAGSLVPVAEGVEIERALDGIAHLAVSRNANVAFVPSSRTFVLVLVEPDGRERVVTESLMLQNPRFSPDGNRIVVATQRNPGERTDLWIHDLKGGAPATRLTFDGGRAPVWTPDGAVTYSYPGSGEKSGIYSKPADGRGEAQRIVTVPTFHWLVGWAPSQTLVYGMMEPAPLAGEPASSILAFKGAESRRLVGPGRAWGGRLSRDGGWLVYYTLDSGYFEVYATPFPNVGVKSLIAEGTDPQWSPDGSEIYYRSGSRLMAARVERSSSAVRVLSRRVVVEPFIPPLYDDYDIHPDGRTLVLVRPAGELRGREVALLLNWQGVLGRVKPQ